DGNGVGEEMGGGAVLAWTIRPAAPGARYVMPPKAGSAAASALKACSARSALNTGSEGPSAFATTERIIQSGHDSPRGGMAVRKRCTRPWKFVKVPSVST